ncbi:hypothetical protein X801_01665 [Opisthorchis viverrini]|uniref:Uncharacterized protein n=1 Tax=Opisthorchis viverrini TaxID=6198 RepID=A0A1S8X6T5_OPIVI|nr:hypothetical protein X801_01665 [Opisthorchis viverrini]
MSHMDMVFSLAEELLRAANQNSRLTLPRTQAGWMMLAAYMTLGPDLVKPHLPRMLLFWRNAFTRSLRELEAEKQRGDAFTWQFHLHCTKYIPMAFNASGEPMGSNSPYVQLCFPEASESCVGIAMRIADPTQPRFSHSNCLLSASHQRPTMCCVKRQSFLTAMCPGFSTLLASLTLRRSTEWF